MRLKFLDAKIMAYKVLLMMQY